MSFLTRLFGRRKNEEKWRDFVDELTKAGEEFNEKRIDEIRKRHDTAAEQGMLPAPDIAADYDCECGAQRTMHIRHMNLDAGLDVQCADCGAVLHVPPTILDHSEYWPAYGGASLVPDWRAQLKFVKHKMAQHAFREAQSRLSADTAFAQFTVAQSGKNLRHWTPPLSADEIQELVDFATKLVGQTYESLVEEAGSVRPGTKKKRGRRTMGFWGKLSLFEGARIIHTVSKGEVLARDVSQLVEAIDGAVLGIIELDQELSDLPDDEKIVPGQKLLKRIRLVEFSVSGYDEDPRPLWALAETREWAWTWVQKQPYCLPLLEDQSCLALALLCLGGFKSRKYGGFIPDFKSRKARKFKSLLEASSLGALLMKHGNPWLLGSFALGRQVSLKSQFSEMEAAAN